MKNVLKARLSKQIIIWLLFTVIVLYFVTGLGITQFRIVESVTFGLLSKPLSFQIHNYLWVPFVVFLGLHIYQRTRRHNTK